MNIKRVLAIVASLALLAGAAGWRAYSALTTPVALDGAPVAYELEPGRSLRGFAEDMAKLGLIDSPRWLVWYGRLSGGAASLKRGEYLIEPGTSPIELLQRIQAGAVLLHPITFVEGWTFARWRAEIAANEWIRRDLVELSDDEIPAALGLADESPEGLFFPDTYRFPRGTNSSEVLRRAADRMNRILAREWATRDPNVQLGSPRQALILASMVEKESGVPSDREKIAAVFLRRLAKGLRLQSDPTVIYGLGAAFDGDLKRRDLERDTPYNTYVHYGLPPTPICTPGREAIRAALHPAPGSSLYFVAKGDGTSYFSDTLEEHNRAVKQYQIEKKPGEEGSRQPADALPGAPGGEDQ